MLQTFHLLPHFQNYCFYPHFCKKQSDCAHPHWQEVLSSTSDQELSQFYVLCDRIDIFTDLTSCFPAITVKYKPLEKRKDIHQDEKWQIFTNSANATFQSNLCVSSAKTRATNLSFIFQQVKAQVQTSDTSLMHHMKKITRPLWKQKGDGLWQEFTTS